jgi:hypothetical protein
MAGSYTIQSQRRGPWVLSPTQVLDAEIIGVSTSPHNVYFEVPMSYDGWLRDGADVAVSGIAESIEALLDAGTVLGAAFVQAVDPISGLLADFMEFTIAIPPGPNQTGPMTTTVRVPIGAVGDPMIESDFFAPARAALVFTAGL